MYIEPHPYFIDVRVRDDLTSNDVGIYSWMIYVKLEQWPTDKYSQDFLLRVCDCSLYEFPGIDPI